MRTPDPAEPAAGPSWRERLRALPVFGDGLPGFDAEAAPDEPMPLLAAWLDEAITAGVSQPHAASIATVDAAGRPSNRTLILKDLTDRGPMFSTLATSPKGRDLASGSPVALLLYWRELGRQVRVTGPAVAGPPEDSARDFRQRHPDARAVVLAGEQSEPMPDAAEVERRVAEARQRVDADPELVHEAWRTYLVTPTEVEFWAAAPGREQVRLRYTSTTGAWRRERLWA